MCARGPTAAWPKRRRRLHRGPNPSGCSVHRVRPRRQFAPARPRRPRWCRSRPPAASRACRRTSRCVTTGVMSVWTVRVHATAPVMLCRAKALRQPPLAMSRTSARPSSQRTSCTTPCSRAALAVAAVRPRIVPRCVMYALGVLSLGMSNGHASPCCASQYCEQLVRTMQMSSWSRRWKPIASSQTIFTIHCLTMMPLAPR